MAPMTKMPMTTMSVRRKLEALSTICPSPCVAATISAATSVVQAKPMAMRRPTRMSGSAAGTMAWRSSCQRVAPSERSAFTCSALALRVPARAASAMGAKQAR